mmetsp:Transcript_30327/g.33946  ORF Transcript_30327/g.33946 Transcript_30327/m.33946 type:complete len:101 (-) Transcript_30327:384-686(-)
MSRRDESCGFLRGGTALEFAWAYSMEYSIRRWLCLPDSRQVMTWGCPMGQSMGHSMGHSKHHWKEPRNSHTSRESEPGESDSMLEDQLDTVMNIDKEEHM